MLQDHSPAESTPERFFRPLLSPYPYRTLLVHTYSVVMYSLLLLVCLYAQDCDGLVIPTPSNESSLMEVSSNQTELYDADVDPTINATIPQILSTKLDEKIASLSCDILLPTDAIVWIGNQTHELLLPITIYPQCPSPLLGLHSKTGSSRCPAPVLKWEGEIEIEAGDILLVKIDDAELIRQAKTSTSTAVGRKALRYAQQPTVAVYQVTRVGHENCDISEGVLLDINPLIIYNRRVVALYDKDLTEGINLLIVVSKLWKDQCVRLKVVVKSDNCGTNANCSGKGVCYTNNGMEGYECQCCPGFMGPHCEERDACYPTPCVNNGICVDLSQGQEGNKFQCLCPFGYTGNICNEEIDPCTSMPCQNGATCTGNFTRFKCDCPSGFSGTLCQHNLNECASSPCIHGMCVDHEDGYKCYCQPGYSGLTCDYEYNECLSSPCLNGGTCTDRIGDYTCSCGRGFGGKRCHVKVNLCEPNPCLTPRLCLDTGNNYSCSCMQGFTGELCDEIERTTCNINPCNNGGTCWTSQGSFYCACQPGFTGDTCEDEFVVETVHPNGKEGEDFQVPVTIHLYHLNNIYIALGTLACAFVIVALILAVCHCKINKTYKRFMWRSSLWTFRARRAPVLPTTSNREWFSARNKAPMATPSRSVPALDSTEMYYSLDFGDAQDSPLIQ